MADFGRLSRSVIEIILSLAKMHFIYQPGPAVRCLYNYTVSKIRNEQYLPGPINYSHTLYHLTEILPLSLSTKVSFVRIADLWHCN